MQAFWTSLKENVNCGIKPADVIIRHEKCQQKRTCSADKKTFDNKLINQVRNSFQEDFERHQLNSRTHYCELNIGDPTRNIIEIIFQRASTNPLKPSRKIKRVLRVKNSVEILERFERYRERVKENAYDQQWRHPRSIVDGNELLRFYGATMSCCKDMKTQVSAPCRDPSCRVCRIIQANFETRNMVKDGIRLSSKSEELIDNMVAGTKVKKLERAAILCRTIAGGVVDEPYMNCGSFESGGIHYLSESLVVRNPCAILPCFVIVYT